MRKGRVHKECVICGAVFEVAKSVAPRHSTCSKDCGRAPGNAYRPYRGEL